MAKRGSYSYAVEQGLHGDPLTSLYGPKDPMWTKTDSIDADIPHPYAPHVPVQPLSTVIRMRELNKGYEAWKKWLKNEDVPKKLRHVTLTAQDEEGWTPLHYASRHYRPDILTIAKDLECPNQTDGPGPATVAAREGVFNVKTTDKLTPRLVAAKYNRKNSVLWLLQDGCDLVDKTAVDHKKRNAIHLAVQDLNCEYTLKTLFQQRPEEPDLCSEKDVEGNLPLHLAAEMGNVEALDNGLLDVYEWDKEKMEEMIHEKNVKGMTPLHLAAMHGRVEVVRKITAVNQEAVTITEKEGNFPLHFACKNGHTEVTQVIVDVASKCIKEADEMDEKRKAWQDAVFKAGKMRHSLATINNVDSESPLHCAAYNSADSADLVNIVMKTYTKCGIRLENELQRTNSEGYTPLMLACKEGKPNVVGAILKTVCLLNGCRTLSCLYKSTVGKGGMNCLDLAIDHGHREVVEVIITSRGHLCECDVSERYHWKDSLRHTTQAEDGTETTPFRRLIRKMPDLALRAIERCEEDSCYEFVNDFQESWGPDSYRRDNHPLDIMVQEGCKDLLKHKKIHQWLNIEWGSLGVWLYLLNLITYLIFVIFLTTFALKLPHPQSKSCANETNVTPIDQQNDNATKGFSGVSDTNSSFCIFSVVVLIILSLVELILEVILFYSRFREIYRGGFKKIHFQDWKFVLDFPLFSLSAIFVIIAVSNDTCGCPTPSEWRLGTFVVFCAWFNLLTFLYKFPKLGVYLVMLEQIVKKFVTVMIPAVLVFLGFGFAFYMIFYEPIPSSPFTDPGISILKSLSMAAGGQLDSVFRFSNMGSGDWKPVPYSGLGYVFWILFMAVVVILFLNFLIGLAVEDVSKLQQRAHFEILKLKVKHVLGTEEVLHILPNPMQSFFNKCKECLKVLEDTKVSKVIHYLWGTEDSDLTIEEKETDYKVERIIQEQDNVIVRLQEQERMIRELRDVIMKKFKD